MRTAFPPEINDSIIDNLFNDPKALSACSLVSSEWLAPSRHHLFGQVKLETENAPGFLQLLCSPYCTLSPFVQQLDVEEGSYTADLWLGAAISALATTLLSVRTLRIYNLSWRDLGIEALASIHDNFKLVVDLDLDLLAIDYFAPLAKFICSFPVLARLSCQSILLCAPDEEDINSAFHYHLPSCTKSLFLRLPEASIVNWLLAQPSIHDVHTAVILYREKSLTPCVSDLLHSMGSALRYLEISMPLDGPGPDADSDVSLNLSSNPYLRYLHLVPLSFYGEKNGVTKSNIRWLPEFLSGIISESIEEIAFGLRPRGPDDFDLYWPDLHQVLENSYLIRLRVVRFLISGRIPRAEIYSRIRILLPECEARGILRFGYDDMSSLWLRNRFNSRGI